MAENRPESGAGVGATQSTTPPSVLSSTTARGARLRRSRCSSVRLLTGMQHRKIAAQLGHHPALHLAPKAAGQLPDAALRIRQLRL